MNKAVLVILLALVVLVAIMLLLSIPKFLGWMYDVPPCGNLFVECNR